MRFITCGRSSNVSDSCSPLTVPTFVAGIVVIEVWHTGFPVWTFCFSLLIAFVYVIPAGMIEAITNQPVGLNVITELIVGYILPGRPIAMMLFKTWGTATMHQALKFTSDFKLGHYMKIPPRQMFWDRRVHRRGTVQVGVQEWMFTHIPDMCSHTQKDGFTCPHTEVFGAASIIWGVIGPMRVFSSGHLYSGLIYWFLVGAICPVIAYLIRLRWPNSFIRFVNPPVIFNGAAFIAFASGLNFASYATVGFVFQYYIRKRYLSWWMKYNFILSAGLSAGLACGIMLVFFTPQYPRNGTIGENVVQAWWGNTVWQTTADGLGLPYKSLPASGRFGPTTW